MSDSRGYSSEGSEKVELAVQSPFLLRDHFSIRIGEAL